MGRGATVVWTCDAPLCGNTEHYKPTSRYDEGMPKGWSTVTLSVNGEYSNEEDCPCKCHVWPEPDDWARNKHPQYHDEEDCPCEEYGEDSEDEKVFCKSCTGELKIKCWGPMREWPPQGIVT